jgi:DNA-directed RNA polymerase specialized sigma24 family protein
VKWPADRDREFTEFVMVQRAALVRVAALLVSGDMAKAEDVVQTALTKLYLAWPRVRSDTAGAYARRCVVNAAMDDRRSLFSKREQVSAQLPDFAAVDPRSAARRRDGDGGAARRPAGRHARGGRAAVRRRTQHRGGRGRHGVQRGKRQEPERARA